ncbi:MAG: aspartate 1-decarboxylase [Elusimicrobiota bacterium]|jgi:aspartate 1-decarboxylase|nr:aspartate 1-decarboxylase [Elusimicrobiota bacterium]
MKFILSSKIHRAIVTQAELNYEGSISIDKALCDACGLWKGEKVLVVSNTTGARLETYVIFAPEMSGTICMNGAAAHLIKKGEEIIIMGFTLSDKPINSKVVLVDDKNHISEVKIK